MSSEQLRNDVFWGRLSAPTEPVDRTQNVVRVLYAGSDADVVSRLLSAARDSSEEWTVCTTTGTDSIADHLSSTTYDSLVVDWPVSGVDAGSFFEYVRAVSSNLTVMVRSIGDETPLPGSVEAGVDHVLEGDHDLVEIVRRSAAEPTGSGPRNTGDSDVRDETDAIDRIARVRSDGVYQWVNDWMAESLDAPPGEIPGQFRLDTTPPRPGVEDLLELGRAAIESGQLHQKRTFVDGRYYQYLTLPLDGRDFLLVERDVSQFKDAKRRFELTNSFVETVINRLGDLFFVFDHQGDFVHWNDRVNEVTGYDDEEIARMHPIEFFPEDEHETVQVAIGDILATGESTRDLHLLTRDGEKVPYEFSGSVIEDADGTPLYICGIGRDIGPRIRAERELEDAIEELERSNAELEQFAYVASHDLKQPLRMITSYLELIEGRYADELDENGEEFIAYAVDGAERMRRLIDDLLTYSRIGTEETFEPVDCDIVVRRALENLKIAIEESGAAISVDPLPTVLGDENQLLQLFQNVLDNAIEYGSDDDPRVRVSAERDDDEWVFSVRDNGRGIAPEERDRVFEVFSTGRGSEGTGIGLATCRKIVRRHEGKIWLDSEPGDGTTVRFTIPLEREAPDVDAVDEASR